MPLISVIVPVYNVEPYIHRCVDSILAQTFTDFELILVDDGSPDNCGMICDEYAKKDDRITVIHQENGGLSAARNAGIDWAFENSDSEWISFIDSDDWVHPKYLELLYKCVVASQVNIAICNFARVPNKMANAQELFLEQCPYMVKTEEYYVANRVNATVAWAKLYDKKTIQSIRYPVGKLHEDEFTTYKILFQYDFIGIIDIPLYYYYVNEESIMSATWTPKRMDSLDAFKEQLLYFERSNNMKALRQAKHVYLKSYAKAVERLAERHLEQYEIRKRMLRSELFRYYTRDNFNEKDKWLILSSAFPGVMKFVKLIRKKITNLKEVLFPK